jgi:DNA-binding beta-propeller fold protein YncE
MNTHKQRWRKLSILLVLISMLVMPVQAQADAIYSTFTLDSYNNVIYTQPAYNPVRIIGNDLYEPDPFDPKLMMYSPFMNPKDIFIDNKDQIYVADTGMNRIVHLNENGEFIRFIRVEESPLNQPEGVFVSEQGDIYVADTANQRVVKLGPDGKLLQEFKKPVSRYVPEDLKYDPIKVVVDKRGYLYVVTLGGYYGMMQLSADGEFQKFYGANKAPFSATDQLKRMLYTREMYANELSKLPMPILNATIDKEGFIYSLTAGGATTNQVKKLNFGGQDILNGNNTNQYGESFSAQRRNTLLTSPLLVDVGVDPFGNFTVLDQNFKFISQYDANGSLLFFWGGDVQSDATQFGVVKNPASIAVNSKNEMFILDDQANVIQMYKLSEFGSLVHHANQLTLEGRYQESKEPWHEVLQLNANYAPAMIGLAKAYYQEKNYKEAARLYKEAGDQKGFSDAFWQIRLQWFQEQFSLFATVVLLAVVLLAVYSRISKMKFFQSIRKSQGARTQHPLLLQLKHTFYILKHPIDGFSALRYENKGGFLSSIIILVMAFIGILISEIYTSFSFNKVIPEKVNVFMIFIQFVVIWILWVVCNYLISSIYRGEGRFKDVFYGSVYALVPLIIVGIPLTLISNVMTQSELSIYQYIENGMLLWVVALFFWKVQSLQNYSVGETIANILYTILAMCALTVVAFVMFGLSSELRLFLYEIYQEVMLR